MDNFLREKAELIGEDVKIKGTNYLFRVEEFFLEEKDEYFRKKKKEYFAKLNNGDVRRPTELDVQKTDSHFLYKNKEEEKIFLEFEEAYDYLRKQKKEKNAEIFKIKKERKILVYEYFQTTEGKIVVPVKRKDSELNHKKISAMQRKLDIVIDNAEYLKKVIDKNSYNKEEIRKQLREMADKIWEIEGGI